MKERSIPLQPPIQPKLDPGDRIFLHALGVRWDEPEQIEAPKGGDSLSSIAVNGEDVGSATHD